MGLGCVATVKAAGVAEIMVTVLYIGGFLTFDVPCDFLANSQVSIVWIGIVLGKKKLRYIYIFVIRNTVSLTVIWCHVYSLYIYIFWFQQ